MWELKKKDFYVPWMPVIPTINLIRRNGCIFLLAKPSLTALPWIFKQPMDNQLRLNKAEPSSPLNSPEKVNEDEQLIALGLLCSELFNKDHKTTKCHGTCFIGPSYCLTTSRKKMSPNMSLKMSPNMGVLLREADTGCHASNG